VVSSGDWRSNSRPSKMRKWLFHTALLHCRIAPVSKPKFSHQYCKISRAAYASSGVRKPAALASRFTLVELMLSVSISISLATLSREQRGSILGQKRSAAWFGLERCASGTLAVSEAHLFFNAGQDLWKKGCCAIFTFFWEVFFKPFP